MKGVPWYRRTFNEDYLSLYGEYLDERTPHELAGIKKFCQLRPGDRILDLACGHGRHSVPLAGQGHRVVGLDLSSFFLEIAARHQEPNLSWVQMDMRDLPFEEEFDVVLSLYHAFGYFDDEADNRRVLQKIQQALVPGGVVLIDLIAAHSLDQQLGELEVSLPGYDLLERVEHRDRRLEIEQTFLYPGKAARTYHHSLRIYEPEELSQALLDQGLQVKASWGDFDGRPYGEGERLILLAQKPKAGSAEEETEG